MSSRKTLTLLRVAIGLLFLILSSYKVFGRQFTSGGGFEYWINRFLAEGAYPFMVPVLKNFVLPHAHSLAYLAAVGELAIGLSLVLGWLTRVASFCGMVYMLALMFSANYPGAHAPLWQYFGASLEHSVLALCFATFALTRRGQMSSFAHLLKRPSLGGVDMGNFRRRA